MKSLNWLVGYVSIHINSLSLFLPVEAVDTKFQVAPWSIDLNTCTRICVPKLSIPKVVAHAVPSEEKARAGSECIAIPEGNGSSVFPHVTPPSVEKNCLCLPDCFRLFEAAIRNCGWL